MSEDIITPGDLSTAAGLLALGLQLERLDKLSLVPRPGVFFVPRFKDEAGNQYVFAYQSWTALTRVRALTIAVKNVDIIWACGLQYDTIEELVDGAARIQFEMTFSESEDSPDGIKVLLIGGPLFRETLRTQRDSVVQQYADLGRPEDCPDIDKLLEEPNDLQPKGG